MLEIAGSRTLVCARYRSWRCVIWAVSLTNDLWHLARLPHGEQPAGEMDVPDHEIPSSSNSTVLTAQSSMRDVAHVTASVASVRLRPVARLRSRLLYSAMALPSAAVIR